MANAVTGVWGRAGAVPDGALRIGGARVAATDDRAFAVLDPATGAELGRVADAAVTDARAALDAAEVASAAWRRVAPRERAAVLHRAADLLEASREPAARLVTLEMGKPLTEARSEVDYARDFLRYYAEEARRIGGRTAVSADGAARLATHRVPVGPCVLVTPWNFPLAMGARKLAPALAAGCTAIVKPAPQTPLSMLWLADVLAEAGVPAGVVAVLPTTRAEAVVAALLADPRTRKLSFTGSTAVGRALLRVAADGVLRTSMELGGNAPFVVFADADLDVAVASALAAKMRNGGAACTAANRFLVEAPLLEAFTARLAAGMHALRVGAGVDPETDVGPLIDAAQLERVDALVKDARRRGARVVCGGSRAPWPALAYRPTVLADVPADARVLHEEVFGPVAPIVGFGTEEEAVARANHTPYGLVAYACTTDLDRAGRLADELDVGMLGLNTGVVSAADAPFGGVGQSGFGREGGPEGIEEYLETRYVRTADGAARPPS